MDKALFLNGVYESVLKEIVSAQESHHGEEHYLQPYSGGVIRELAKLPPSKESPVTLYISKTDRLKEISYVAEIVGWEDKRTIPPERLEVLNGRIRKWQPEEGKIYRERENGRKCVNLISIVNLREVPNPISVKNLIKVNDKTPYKGRPRAGGWSYVYELPDWVGEAGTYLKEQLDEELDDLVRESREIDDDERKRRISAASKFPDKVQVISLAYRRNPHVITEVMKRAAGVCERCNRTAPFIKAKDGTPYLEIHHWKPLSENGEDTVENAAALCPNCHRELHFGKGKGVKSADDSCFY